MDISLIILAIYLSGVIVAWPSAWLIMKYIIPSKNHTWRSYVWPLISSWWTIICSIWLIRIYFHERRNELEEEEK